MSESAATVETCTIEDLGIEITGSDAPPLVAAVNKYLSIFAKPVRRKVASSILGGVDCFRCGVPLDGMLGSFTWGIVHGEGVCGKCGWPCRAYHSPTDEDGDEIFDGAIALVLQYHPDQVVREEKESQPS